MRIPVFLALLAFISMFCIFGCLEFQKVGSTAGNATISSPNNISENFSSIPLASGNITSVANNTSENATSANASQNSGNASNASASQNGENETNANENASNTNAPQTSENISGIFFGNNEFVLVLDDVSVAGNSVSSCGIFSIRYSENASIVPGSNFLGCPPDSHYWRSPENETFRIRVEKVAAGYTKESRWAQVSIFG